MTDSTKQIIKEKLERIKFKCPSCPLPHNLSSLEIDRLFSLFQEYALEIVGETEKKIDVTLKHVDWCKEDKPKAQDVANYFMKRGKWKIKETE